MGETAVKSLHQCFLEQLDASFYGLASVVDYRMRMVEGKPCDKPNLSLALRQFPDVFFMPNPDAPSENPKEKLLDWKVNNLQGFFGQIKTAELGKERTPLKALMDGCEKLIKPDDQARFDKIANYASSELDKFSVTNLPLVAMTRKGERFETTKPENAANFFKCLFLDAVDKRYAGSGLDTNKHRPSDPTPATNEKIAGLTALVNQAKDPSVVSQAVEELKASVAAATNSSPIQQEPQKAKVLVERK